MAVSSTTTDMIWNTAGQEEFKARAFVCRGRGELVKRRSELLNVTLSAVGVRFAVVDGSGGIPCSHLGTLR
jgi:hypothetical protein